MSSLVAMDLGLSMYSTDYTSPYCTYIQDGPGGINLILSAGELSASIH